MKVVVDGGPATVALRTGVGTYVWNLLRRLPLVDPTTEYVGWYAHPPSLRGHRRYFEDAGIIERPLPLPRRLIDRTAHFGLPLVNLLAPCDVVFGTGFVPPPSRFTPTVITVHDLAFRLFPETAPETRRWWHRAVERSVRRATRIIVPSLATGSDLRRVYGVESDRVVVIPMGVDRSVFSPVSVDRIEAVRRRFSLVGPYLVFLGSHPRKNLHGLLRAFAQIPDAIRPTLVVTGEPPRARDRFQHDALAALPDGVRRQVAPIGYVPQLDAAALLSGSVGLTFPTFYEGFGFPALEAMACGTPVLTSNTSSLPELVGDAAILVDPNDQTSIAAGLLQLLTDEPLRRRLGVAGLERAARYDWDTTARATAAVLHDVAKIRRPHIA